MSVYYSFTDYYLLTPDMRKFVGLDNFINLFQDPIFSEKLGEHTGICRLGDSVTDRGSSWACPPVK